jgi:DNA-binding Lrp family transcriptional regulator
MVSEHDEIVYRYVVEKRGEISLSRASTDLHMTIPELQASIRRLEDSGKISREGLGGG